MFLLQKSSNQVQSLPLQLRTPQIGIAESLNGIFRTLLQQKRKIPVFNGSHVPMNGNLAGQIVAIITNPVYFFLHEVTLTSQHGSFRRTKSFRSGFHSLNSGFVPTFSKYSTQVATAHAYELSLALTY